MSVRHLDALFNPASIALIGASTQPTSLGLVVMRNLLRGGFQGPIMPVNPKYAAVAGVLAYRDVASLPVTPDLALICTPPESVAELIAELGERGTRAAIVLTAARWASTDLDRSAFQKALLRAARPHTVRILGPNCLGLLIPGVGLNASFSHLDALPGQIAFVSQSGALCTSVLDWARANGIGFSHFVSLGDSIDVDFGDVLDYLGSEPATRAILLYIEAISGARKFMSAARAAARNKPILYIKAGRVAEGLQAAASHTGALGGADDISYAAFRRTGMLRVYEIDELFDAVETLGRARPWVGERLCILTNGGGPGVMATDSLISQGGQLATLSEETIQELDKVLPPTWSRGNPIDIIGDASCERYAAALKVLRQDPGVDALLVMHSPTGIVSGEEAARTVIREVRDLHRNVLTSWLGATEPVLRARRLFADAGIPTYETPGQAVRAFLYIVRYRRNQAMLMQTPASTTAEFTPLAQMARLVIEEALSAGRTMLTEPEAKAVLAAYGVPVVETYIVGNTEDAVRVAAKLGLPVALKILSPDVTHKSDVGGVALDLETLKAVEEAAEAMKARLKSLLPTARLAGFTVQKMARRPNAHELLIGVATDPTFGPYLVFGQGGKAVEVINDFALGLPPLNMNLAAELIARTRVAKLLQGYRDLPPADLAALRLTLLQVSQLIIDMPEITELDINPLLADEKGVLALDARIVLTPARDGRSPRLAIRPYPRELEEWTTSTTGRKVLLRPIRPEDEGAHQAFFARLTPEDIRFRFFGLVRQIPHTEMARFTQIDFDREMAFIATAADEKGQPETLGVVRAVADPDQQRSEFAIIVRSDMKGLGLGQMLLEKMIRYCRQRGYREMVGEVLRENRPMLALAHRLGFASRVLPDGGTVEVKLALNQGGRRLGLAEEGRAGASGDHLISP